MRRILITIFIGWFFLLGCAPLQKFIKKEESVSKQAVTTSKADALKSPTGQTQGQSKNEALQQLEEFFGVLPPEAIKNAAIYPEPVISQEEQRSAEISDIASSVHSPLVSFQAIQPSRSVPQTSLGPQEGDAGQGVGLNFENADIHDVTKVVSEITGKSFIVDKDVEGSVTLYSEETLSPTQVFNLFKSALELNNLAIIRVGDFYKIVRSEDAPKRSLTVGTITYPAEEDRLVTQIVKLKYVSAKEVKEALKSLTSSDENIIVYPETEDANTLIITDLASNVRKLLEIIREMDVSQYANRYIEVFPIKHAELEDLINDLQQILLIPGATEPLAQMADQPAQQETPAEQPETQQPVSPIVPPGTKTNLYPITRLNALMVSSTYPEVITLVGKWIDILDQPSFKEEITEEIGDPDVPINYVYFVKYAKAEELAPKLAEIYAQGIEPMEQPVQQQQQDQPGDQEQPEQQQQPVQPTTENQEPAPIFITEPTTNSIIIKATPTQYAQINKLLEKLDQRPLQVLIDVIIAEVSLTDTDVFGVKGMIRSQGQATIGGETTAVEATTETDFPGAQSGFSYAITAPGWFYVKLQALATESRVKVLASPNILVRNNYEAKINIGDSIPLQKTKKENDEEIIEWEYKETGIILTVTPQINFEGDVVLKIVQEVSTPGPATGDNAPPINKTNATTSLVTYDGHPLVIGGLIRSRDTKSTEGVPILKDIPLLGRLFRYNNTQIERKELLLLVTPRIIRTPEQGWNLTDDVLTRQIRRLEQLFNREKTDSEKVKGFLKRQISPQE